MSSKRCTKCEETKDYSEFSPHKTCAGGVLSVCKDCMAAYQRNLPPEKVRANNLWYRHGLRLNDLEDLLDLQGWTCLLCPKKFKSRADVHIDHDHSCPDCGEVKSCPKCRRGLLCRECNHLIGHLEKKRNRLANAFRYLGWDLEDV